MSGSNLNLSPEEVVYFDSNKAMQDELIERLRNHMREQEQYFYGGNINDNHPRVLSFFANIQQFLMDQLNERINGLNAELDEERKIIEQEQDFHNEHSHFVRQFIIDYFNKVISGAYPISDGARQIIEQYSQGVKYLCEIYDVQFDLMNLPDTEQDLLDSYQFVLEGYKQRHYQNVTHEPAVNTTEQQTDELDTQPEQRVASNRFVHSENSAFKKPGGEQQPREPHPSLIYGLQRRPQIVDNAPKENQPPLIYDKIEVDLLIEESEALSNLVDLFKQDLILLDPPEEHDPLPVTPLEMTGSSSSPSTQQSLNSNTDVDATGTGTRLKYSTPPPAAKPAAKQAPAIQRRPTGSSPLPPAAAGRPELPPLSALVDFGELLNLLHTGKSPSPNEVEIDERTAAAILHQLRTPSGRLSGSPRPGEQSKRSPTNTGSSSSRSRGTSPREKRQKEDPSQNSPRPTNRKKPSPR